MPWLPSYCVSFQEARSLPASFRLERPGGAGGRGGKERGCEEGGDKRKGGVGGGEIKVRAFSSQYGTTAKPTTLILVILAGLLNAMHKSTQIKKNHSKSKLNYEL